MTSHSSPHVWKVWSRYGSLKQASLLELPDLPYLPYQSPPRAYTGGCAHTRTRARIHTQQFMSGRYGRYGKSAIEAAFQHPDLEHRYGKVR
jgi:hypothetical protein